MAKKRETPNVSLNPVQQFIQSLDQQVELNTFVSAILEFTAKRTLPIPSQQLADIQLNLHQIEELPLSRLQLVRLIQHKQNYELAGFFDQFSQIVLPHIKVTTPSRQVIDPYCKSEQDYSSSINHYKKHLVQVLFILFGYLDEVVRQDQVLTLDYIFFINHIYQATTSSRISLREQPNVQSSLLAELARNSLVQVFGQPVNTHWVKVHVQHEDALLEGYLQLVYLKPLIPQK